MHYPQRVNDTPFAILAQYQAEYRGIVQYYRLAYNLQQLSQLKRVMELSLVKTLAKKLKTSCRRLYQQMGTMTTNEGGSYKVLEVRVERGPDKHPLVAQFGGIPLQWNKWMSISDTFTRSGANAARLPNAYWQGPVNCVERKRQSKPTISASSPTSSARGTLRSPCGYSGWWHGGENP